MSGEKKNETQSGSSLFQNFQDQAFMSFIEGLIPKLQPFIEPMEGKLADYFGDDEKIFVMRKSAGKPIQVIVFDNTKASYEISNEIQNIEGSEETKRVKKFVADPESIIAVINVGEFVQKLLSGQFIQETK